MPAPKARPIIVTISSSKVNCAATLTLFTPMAVSTPISYLRSRTFSKVMTTSTTPPTASTTMSNVSANFDRLSSGTKLDS